MLDISSHREVFNPHEFRHNIHVIGVGATGSWLTLALAKLGLTQLHVWDDDHVEEHNLANQAYGVADVGRLKVEALQAAVLAATGTTLTMHAERVTNQRLHGVVFCVVDSMAARREIWEQCAHLQLSVPLWVEPRLGVELVRVYTVNPLSPTHLQRYEREWYGDDVAEVSACGTSLSVVNSALTAAATCTRQLISWHKQGWLDLPNELLLDLVHGNAMPTVW